jgi:hypothetical protein
LEQLMLEDKSSQHSYRSLHWSKLTAREY